MMIDLTLLLIMFERVEISRWIGENCEYLRGVYRVNPVMENIVPPFTNLPTCRTVIEELVRILYYSI